MRIKAIFLLFSFIILILASCKELNEDYPPVPWKTYFYKTENIAPFPVSAILYENEKHQWLGSQQNHGLLFNNGKSWTSYDKSNTGLAFDSITFIIRDGLDRLWVGWKSGLAQFDGKQWIPIERFDGLRVTSAVVEGVGNLWIGLYGDEETGGLAHFSNDTWTFLTPANSSIPSGKINKVALDRMQGLWVCSSDQAVFRYYQGNWINFDYHDSPVTSYDFRSLCIDQTGKVWAGSTASQLICFADEKMNVMETGTLASVNSLLHDGNDNLWCGTIGGGLLKLSGGKWSAFTVNNSRLPSDTILQLAYGPKDFVLFSLAGNKVLMIQ